MQQTDTSPQRRQQIIGECSLFVCVQAAALWIMMIPAWPASAFSWEQDRWAASGFRTRTAVLSTAGVILVRGLRNRSGTSFHLWVGLGWGFL